MPLPFLTWTLDMVRAVLTSALAANTERSQKFMQGDHWQDRWGWMGPRPSESDAEYDLVFSLIQENFCSENVIKEVVERHAGGVLGREPVWGFTPARNLKAGEKPTEDEQRLIDEVEALLTEWWNKRGAHGVLRKALEKALWAEHGPVRCFVPSGKLDRWTVKGRDSEGNEVDVPRAGLRLARGDVRAALDRIFIESPEPTNSAVVKDDATQVEVGITRYEMLINEADPTSDKEEFYELVWVDDETGETFFRVIGEDDTDNVFHLNLGGHRTVYSVNRAPLITDQIIQNQKAMNTAITLSPKNMADASFLERTFLGARMPGHEEEYEDAVTHQKKTRWVRDDFVTGPGAVNFVQPEAIQNPDGTYSFTNPSLVHKPPTSLQPIYEGAEFHHLLILKEGRQTHILKNEEGRASGKSHEQARVDYNISLNDSKEPSEDSGRTVLSAVVAWAELLAGVPGRYTSKLRAFFECQLDLGPVSQDERSQNRQDVEAGLMDDETAMARAGILDVDKTKAIIAARPDARLRQLLRLAEIAQKAGNKIAMSVLAKLAKFDTDEIALMEKAEKEALEREEKKHKAEMEAKAKQPPAIPGTRPRNVRSIATGGSSAAA